MHLLQHGRLDAVSFETTRCTNSDLSQLVAKCEIILCMTSCMFDERAREAKSVALADALSTIRNNKLTAKGEKLETLAKLRAFVSNISSPR